MAGEREGRQARTIELVGGYVVVPEVSARGGQRYRREQVRRKEINRGRGVEAVIKTVKRVEDVALAAEAQQIVTRSYYLLDAHCTRTPLGYWVPEERLAELDGAFEGVRAAASAFNAKAEEVGIHVVAEFYPLAVDLANERVATRLAAHVRDRLREIREVLRSGDVKGAAWETAWERARNLPALATGFQREAVEAALETARAARRLISAQVRGGAVPSEAGASADVDAIEAAEQFFT